MWIGIDVGGRRKGFHAAAMRPDLQVELRHFQGAAAADHAADWVEAWRPVAVAVDCPPTWAEHGRGSRLCEVDFAHAGICGIRYTPDDATAAARTDTYYEWIEQGQNLFGQLRDRDVPTLECFPTASWTQWFNPRGHQRRTQWTRQATRELVRRGLASVDVRNQDQRDAIAAALTARQASTAPRSVMSFGSLVVPCRSSDPLG